jgi:curved DNA-binding protein CbpA
MKNYYQILGIQETASKEQVKKAYKQLSLKYHPDKNNGDHFYSELFKNINEANQVLSNDSKRAEYDFLLNDYFHHIRKWQQSDAKRNERGFAGYEKVRNRLFKAGWLAGGLAVVSLLLLLLIEKEIIPNVFETPQEVDILNLRLLKDETVTEPRLKDPVKKSPLPGKIEMKHIYSSIVHRKKQPKPDQKKSTVFKVSEIKKTDSPYVRAQKLPQTKSAQQALAPKESIEKILTEQQMINVYNDITNKKRDFHNASNCVKIFKTNNCNIKNAFAIATFLQRKGFTIAGREKSGNDAIGINIAATHNCITVTVGAL